MLFCLPKTLHFIYLWRRIRSDAFHSVRRLCGCLAHFAAVNACGFDGQILTRQAVSGCKSTMSGG